MNTKKPLAVLLSAALTLTLAACGAKTDSEPVPTVTPEAAEPEATETVAYDGPLYEISYERMTDTVPYFQTIRFSPQKVTGLVLRQNFTWDELYTVYEKLHTIGNGETYSSYNRFCTADMSSVPLEGDYVYEGSYNGYHLFAYNDGTFTSSGDGVYTANYYTQLFDKDFNLVYDSTNQYDLAYSGPAHIFLESGRIPGVKHGTDENGFFDLYTQEWHPVSAEYKTTNLGEFNYNGVSYYSDGVAVVAYLNSPYEKTYAVFDSQLRHTDSEMAGFIDTDGNWIFQFRDLPQFDGQVVNSSTGYLNGECMISTRSNAETVTDSVGSNMLLDRDHIYKIDKQGNILEEADYDAFVAFYEEVLKANHQHYNFSTNSDSNYHVDSVQIADGLTLKAVNPLNKGTIVPISDANQYELVDANGNTYPLGIDSPELILVGDNGIVLIESNETEDGEPETIDGANPYDENTYRVWYKLNLKSLAPEGYTVSDDQKQNLVPASDAVEVEEANIQEQDVYIFGSEDMHDVVLHITYNDASLDYNLRTDDYDGFYDENEYGTPDAEPLLDVISTGFYYIQEDMNTFPDITVDWNDSDGNPHHGTYTEGSVTEE